MIDKKKQAILDAIEKLKSDSIPMESEPIEETTEEQASELDSALSSDDDEESRFEKLKKRLQFLGK